MPPADTPPMLPPSLNHVFVDFENVQAINLAVIGEKGVKFILLIGAGKAKLDFELVERLLLHAASVELVRLHEKGKNALDFALAYYVGRAAAQDPGGFFHIISKDTGYDPLINHLKSQKVRVSRHNDFSTLTFSRPPMPVKTETPAPIAPDKNVEKVLTHLRKSPKNRPKNTKTLTNQISSYLGAAFQPCDAEKMVKQLMSTGYIKVDAKNAVTYALNPL